MPAALGFTGPKRGAGAHHDFLVRGPLKVKLPNPHRGDIDVGLLRRILRNADITVEEWDDAGC